MIRPATRIGLEIVAGIAGVVVVLVAFFGWRLSQGPMQISFLAAIVEDQINESIEGYEVSVGDTVIAWTREAGAVEFVAVDVRVIGEQDRTVAELPRMAMDFRVLPLLEGRAVPKRLALEGAQLALVRRADGTMRIGLTGPDENLTDLANTEDESPNAGDGIMSALLDAVSTPDEGGKGIPRLEGLSVRKAAFTVFDERSGGLWLAPDVELEFRNTPRGMAGVVQADVLSPGGEWKLVGTVRASGSDGPIVLSADVNNLRLPDFSRTMEVLSPLAMVDAAVTGRLVAELSRDGFAIQGMSLDLSAGPGTVRVPVDAPAPYIPPPPLNFDGTIPETPEPPPYEPEPWTYDIDGARIVADLTWPEGHIDLKEFTLEGERLKGTWTGQADAAVGEDNSISSVEMTLAGADIAAAIPNVTVGVMRLDTVSLAMGLDTRDWSLAIEEAAIGLDEGRIWLGGSVSGLDEGPVSVMLDGGIEHIRHDDMMQIWPPRVGHGARQWVEKNVTDGEIVSGTVVLRSPNGELDQKPIPDDAVALDLQYAGQTVSFLQGMSPVREVRGALHLTGNSVEATVVDGFVEPEGGGLVRLSDGVFSTRDFHIRGNDAQIAVTAAGSMSALLALLDEEPLGYTSQFGLDPKQVAGTGKARFDTTLPMRNQLRFSDIRFGATGTARELALPPLGDGLTLANGDLTFSVNNDRLVSEGTLAVNGAPVEMRWTENFNAGNAPSSTYEVALNLDDASRTALDIDLKPYVEGPVYLQGVLRGSGPDLRAATVTAELTEAAVSETMLGWTKPAGRPARMSAELDFPNGTGEGFDITSLAIGGEGIQVTGSASIGAGGRFLSADMPIVMLGADTDMSLKARRTEDGGIAIDVTGRSLDARNVISSMLGGGEDEEEDVADEEEDTGETLLISAKLDQVVAHNGEKLRKADAYFRRDEGRIQQMSLNGVFASEGDLRVELRPTTYNTRNITAHAGNAGAVVRAINVYSDLTGGELAFEAEIDDRKTGSPLSGRLEGGGFRVRNAPVLASILTLGSLTGIRDTLDGDGILFTRLEVPMSMTDSAIDIKDGVVSGPALGGTIKGHLNRVTEEVDLGGTIVPAYSINTFLGNVPILGDLMTSREGEGVIGITYAVSGELDAPTVTVNPLAALLPGIFRRLFEMGGSSSEDELSAAPEVETEEGNTSTGAGANGG